VGFSFRYSSAVQRLRADLAAGVLGEPWLVELWEQNPQFHPVIGRPLTWKADPAHAAGGAVFEYGAHVVDLATWLLGEVATVSSQFATVVPGARLDDLANLQLRFDSGVVGTLTTSWVLGGGFPGIAVRVHGSKGCGEVALGAVPGAEESYTRRNAGGEVAETVAFGIATPRWVHTLRHLEDLVAHVEGVADPAASTLPTLAQAAHVQAVLNTAVNAANRGLRVPR
jgi:predicted dehydrogenase